MFRLPYFLKSGMKANNSPNSFQKKTTAMLESSMNYPAASCRVSGVMRTVWVVEVQLWVCLVFGHSFQQLSSRLFPRLWQHNIRLTKTRHPIAPSSPTAFGQIPAVRWCSWIFVLSCLEPVSGVLHKAGECDLCHNLWLPSKWRIAQLWPLQSPWWSHLLHHLSTLCDISPETRCDNEFARHNGSLFEHRHQPYPCLPRGWPRSKLRGIIKLKVLIKLLQLFS